MLEIIISRENSQSARIIQGTLEELKSLIRYKNPSKVVILQSIWTKGSTCNANSNKN